MVGAAWQQSVQPKTQIAFPFPMYPPTPSLAQQTWAMALSVPRQRDRSVTPESLLVVAPAG